VTDTIAFYHNPQSRGRIVHWIPAIVHRGTVVTECAAICAYLADAFPAAGLAPGTDDPKRGLQADPAQHILLD
jgi:hypothetical protein